MSLLAESVFAKKKKPSIADLAALNPYPTLVDDYVGGVLPENAFITNTGPAAAYNPSNLGSDVSGASAILQDKYGVGLSSKYGVNPYIDSITKGIELDNRRKEQWLKDKENPSWATKNKDAIELGLGAANVGLGLGSFLQSKKVADAQLAGLHQQLAANKAAEQRRSDMISGLESMRVG